MVGIVIVAVISLRDAREASFDADAVASEAALGEQVYDQHCAVCHGPNGEGANPQAPYEPDENGLLPAPPHDANGHTWHHSDALLKQIIREGSSYPDMFQSEMPAFGDRLSEREIESLIAYFKTLWAEDELAIQATVSASDLSDDSGLVPGFPTLAPTP